MHTEQAEEAARQISADVQPIVRHQQGYGGTAFLADRARERVILVTFWESGEARAAAEAAWPADDRVGVFEAIGVRRREARVFEVLWRDGMAFWGRGRDTAPGSASVRE